MLRHPHDEQRRQLDKLQRANLDVVRSIISQGIERGEFDPVDVTAAAFAMSAMLAETFH